MRTEMHPDTAAAINAMIDTARADEGAEVNDTLALIFAFDGGRATLTRAAATSDGTGAELRAALRTALRARLGGRALAAALAIIV